MKRIACILALASAVGGAAATTNSPFRFSGKVVTSDGRTVAAATMARYEYAEDSFFRPGAALEITEQITTQADGGFTLSLPRNSALFVARKSGMAPAWRQSWNVRKDQSGPDRAESGQP
ncbi:MAG: hypothetical protein FJ403_02175 [Verrucomicrobia bacterium]|nr:hypothetical protein [Verrucomicrobiota bacterium]